MFGISIYEFFVILLVAVLVIPARHWGDVIKFLARAARFARDLIWKITDAGEMVKDRIEREMPIDKVMRQTADDVIGVFSAPRKKHERPKGSPSPRRRGSIAPQARSYKNTVDPGLRRGDGKINK